MGGDIDRFRNKQLSLFELLSQGKRCKLYVLHCILYKLVSPELADLGIPPPRVKTETYYRKIHEWLPRPGPAGAGFSSPCSDLYSDLV